MKKWFRFVIEGCIVAAIVVLIIIQFKQTPDKLVYIDSAKLLSEYKGMAQARKAYEVKTSEWYHNIDTLNSELQNYIERYEKEAHLLSVKEREGIVKAVKVKQKQLAEYEEAIELKASEEDLLITQEVLSKINRKINEYGKKNNYKIIFSANETSNILYAEDGLDITSDILELLNFEYEKNGLH